MQQQEDIFNEFSPDFNLQVALKEVDQQSDNELQKIKIQVVQGVQSNSLQIIGKNLLQKLENLKDQKEDITYWFLKGVLSQVYDDSEYNRHLKQDKANECFKKCTEKEVQIDQQEERKQGETLKNQEEIAYQIFANVKWGYNLDYKPDIDERMNSAKKLINKLKWDFGTLQRHYLAYFNELEFSNILVKFGQAKQGFEILDEQKKSNKFMEEQLTLYQALWLYDQQQYQESIEFLQKALEFNENNAKIIFKLAFALSYVDRDDEAEKLYLKCIEYDPKYGKVHFNLGIFYENAENTEKALEHYEICIQKDPMFRLAYNNIGCIKTELGRDSQEIIELYKKAVEIDPQYTLALRNLAQEYEKQSNIEEATKYYLQLQEAEPADFDCAFKLAEIYSDKSENDKSLEQLERCTYIDSFSTKTYLKIGEVYLAKNSYKQAGAVYCQLLKNFPECESEIKGEKIKQYAKTLLKNKTIFEKSIMRIASQMQVWKNSKINEKFENIPSLGTDMLYFQTYQCVL